MKNQIENLAGRIVELQHQYTVEWHVDDNAERPSDKFAALVVAQHKENFDLWHQEDKAREPGVSDASIAQVKRNIDKLNQKRNDMIVELDLAFEKNFFSQLDNGDLPWNSETAGSIIDRLSIASLKVFICRNKPKGMMPLLSTLKNVNKKLMSSKYKGKTWQRHYRCSLKILQRVKNRTNYIDSSKCIMILS